jgi:ubiquinone/menaquinone biosynthesis C-methylase UbiE
LSYSSTWASKRPTSGPGLGPTGVEALDRWLARRAQGANQITGVELNPYLISEGIALARNEGLQQAVEFKEGSGESLPFPDSNFDVAFAVLVSGFVDADRMLAEMVRVTKSGGRAGVIERAEDRPLLVNLPLSPELKAN